MIIAMKSLIENRGDQDRYDIKFSSIRKFLDSVYTEGKEINVQWPRETGDFWGYNY